MPRYVDIHAHGGELSLEMALGVGDTELRQASLDQRGSDLLIETPHQLEGIEERLALIRARGYRVTLTHPERSHGFQAEPGRLEALDQTGVLLALDPESLLASDGAPRALAARLCRGGHAQALAFDPAGDHGAADFARAESAAAALVGPARARWLVADAPAAVVAGEALPEMPDAQRPAQAAEEPESRPPLRARLGLIVLLLPLLAVCVVSFVIIRSQHGSGATFLALQRSAQRLRPSDVQSAVRAAPDPSSHRDALHAHCVPRGTGDLKNPWLCALTYANGDRLQYTVAIHGDGTYTGDHQVVLAPGPRHSSLGSIGGCCVEIP